MHPFRERGDDLVFVGPAAAEDRFQEALVLRCDEFVVGEHVELARDAALELDGQVELVPNLRGETRRAIAVPSGSAEDDADAHGQKSNAITPSSPPSSTFNTAAFTFSCSGWKR